MNRTILILAIIAVLLIAYIAMKSEKTTIQGAPNTSDTVVVQTNDSSLPVPDATGEIIVSDEELPDPQDVAPIDEEIAPAQNELDTGAAKVITVQ